MGENIVLPGLAMALNVKFAKHAIPIVGKNLLPKNHSYLFLRAKIKDLIQRKVNKKPDIISINFEVSAHTF